MAGSVDSGFWSWMGKNSDAFKGVGSLIGGVGQFYGAYQKGKMADKVARFNMKMYEDEKMRRKKKEKNFNLGFIGDDV